MNKTELLAPAGSLESLIAAVESGADAIYLGGTKFSARAFANNFDNETIQKAVKYAHIRGVKVFVTINILITDEEIKDAINFLYFLYNADVDAVIVQDLAMVKIMNKMFPDFNFHCSTQMTIHDINGAIFYKKNGAKRIVFARELSLKQVEFIAENVNVETEVFVHGALCVCFSGQCLMSSLIGGRSGNRGMCAQPCRRRYSLIRLDTQNNEVLNDKFLLSTRDLNIFNKLEHIAKGKITSIKIEGRMKKPEYVAVVVNNYRQRLNSIENDKANNDREKGYKELKSIFNREFTEGYLFGNRNKEIMSIDRPDNRGVYIGKVIDKEGDFIAVLIEAEDLKDGDGIEIIGDKNIGVGGIVSGIRINQDKSDRLLIGQIGSIYFKHNVQKGNHVYKTLDKALNDKALNEYAKRNSKVILLTCEMIVKIGEYPKIIIDDGQGNIVSAIGNEKLKKAENVAITHERIKDQLSKTGDTPYKFSKIEIDIQGDVFLPVSIINTLRREVLDGLSEKRGNFNDRINKDIDNDLKKEFFPQTLKKIIDKKEYIAAVTNIEAAEGAIDAGIDIIYIINTINIKQIFDLCIKKSVKCYFVLPSIIFDNEKRRYEEIIEKYNFSGVVISNIGQYEFLSKFKVKEIRSNYNLNIFNSVAANFVFEYGIKNICLSLELNLRQIRDISNKTEANIESIVYGYMPVMTTEYCPISMSDVNTCNNACKNGEYAIKDHLGKIFRIIKTDTNCRTQILNSDLLFLAEEISKICSSGVRSIRMDFYVESREETRNIVDLYINGQDQIDFKERVDKIKAVGFTKGHFFRGVV